MAMAILDPDLATHCSKGNFLTSRCILTPNWKSCLELSVHHTHTVHGQTDRWTICPFTHFRSMTGDKNYTSNKR